MTAAGRERGVKGGLKVLAEIREEVDLAAHRLDLGYALASGTGIVVVAEAIDRASRDVNDAMHLIAFHQQELSRVLRELENEETA